LCWRSRLEAEWWHKSLIQLLRSDMAKTLRPIAQENSASTKWTLHKGSIWSAVQRWERNKQVVEKGGLLMGKMSRRKQKAGGASRGRKPRQVMGSRLAGWSDDVWSVGAPPLNGVVVVVG
jgi:hypothetical protein